MGIIYYVRVSFVCPKMPVLNILEQLPQTSLIILQPKQKTAGIIPAAFCIYINNRLLLKFFSSELYIRKSEDSCNSNY